MTLGPDPSSWPEAARDELLEREAIMEVLGKMPRDRAQREAEACVRGRWASGLFLGYERRPESPGFAPEG